MYEHLSSSTSVPLLVLLVSLFCVTLAGLDLFAPRNASTLVAIAFGAFAITAAIYLMLEMYSPYQGLIQLSSAPLREAIANLGQ